MDRRIQQLIGLILLITPFSAIAQCQDSIKVSNDTCQIVSMPLYIFTDFYKCKENLKILSEEIPNVKKMADSLHNVNKKLKELNNEQIKTINNEKSLLLNSIDDYRKETASLQIDNIYLNHRVANLKKQRMKIISVAGIVTLIILLIK